MCIYSLLLKNDTYSEGMQNSRSWIPTKKVSKIQVQITFLPLYKPC